MVEYHKAEERGGRYVDEVQRAETRIGEEAMAMRRREHTHRGDGSKKQNTKANTEEAEEMIDLAQGEETLFI
eukprot:c36566_g1_i1 orf=216-431(+)